MSGETDQRGAVYDLLRDLNEVSIPHAVGLFIMGGQNWMSGGYFFEKKSVEAINALHVVDVVDGEGKVVAKLSSKHEFYDAYTSKPQWMESGKSYSINGQVPEQDLETLQKIRNKILDRIRDEGSDAAEEFLMAGTLMGGKEEDPEALVKSLAALIEDRKNKTK